MWLQGCVARMTFAWKHRSQTDCPCLSYYGSVFTQLKGSRLATWGWCGRALSIAIRESNRSSCPHVCLPSYNATCISIPKVLHPQQSSPHGMRKHDIICAHSVLPAFAPVSWWLACTISVTSAEPHSQIVRLSRSADIGFARTLLPATIVTHL